MQNGLVVDFMNMSAEDRMNLYQSLGDFQKRRRHK